ncbi:MAG: hypothetical protein ACLTLY_07745 [Agathobacter rectalis]
MEQQGESNQHDINISNYAAVSHIRNNHETLEKHPNLQNHSPNDNTN